jgi:predicted amidohydrolase YtcJ
VTSTDLRPVDLLFTGGAVFTGTGAPLRGCSVAVREGLIAAVVPDAEARALVGPHTEIVELAGALLSPGFQDAHIHPVGGGLELLQCDLTPAENAEETLAIVAGYAAQTDAEWILGGGWTMAHFAGGAPTRAALDRVVPDRPALLASRDHHSVWANTAAIVAAGLGRDTPDPADGRIEREPDGHPAGTFHEGAEGLFDAVRPAPTAEDSYRGLLRAQDELLALGITGWQDAMIGGHVVGGGGNADAYERAIAEGTLKAHVVGAQWWERDRGLEQVEEMVARRDDWAARVPAERMALGATKLMVDGVAENHTASMLAPYRDGHGHDTDNRGLSFIDPELLKQAVTALDAAGMQPHFHALGDRAVRDALNAVEAARGANGPTDTRPHLAHLQVIDAADVARFAALDAVANIQALWATHEDQMDELTLPFLADGLEARQYPFGDLARSGARFAGGSDWPVSSADPIEAVHVAVNRSMPGSTDGPLAGPEQRLDLATALEAYTAGTAYVNHRDHDTGSIRPGYRADLVVVAPDPFGLDPADLHLVAVTSTWIDGVPVYRQN